MVACIDSDGNPVRLGQGEPTTQQGPTPGPWRLPQVMESPEYEQWVRQYDWHALLLRAVLKGWKLIVMGPADCILKQGRRGTSFDLVFDANGLPACPDADLYEKIRLAVEGQ